MADKNKSVELKIFMTIFFILLALKLSEIITWNWWWIVSPIWCWLGLILMLMILISSIRKTKQIFFHYWYSTLKYFVQMKLADLELELELQFISLEEYQMIKENYLKKINYFDQKLK